MTETELTIEACRADIQTENIKEIVQFTSHIFDKLQEIDSILKDDSLENLRDYESLAKARHYSNEIAMYAESIKRKTKIIEEDLIIWGDSRGEK